jgi:hypothetical protein
MHPVRTEPDDAQDQHCERGEIQQCINHTKRIAVCHYDLSQTRKIPGGNSGAASRDRTVVDDESR